VTAPAAVPASSLAGRPVGTASSARGGFSLVELVVALTLLSIAMVALAGTAALAQRTFAEAEIMERSVNAASVVLDSLAHAPAPVGGQRIVDDVAVEWTVTPAGPALRIDLSAAHQRSGASLDFVAMRPLPYAESFSP
jgi:prepilin-type N-terminal cleavage/methylation domain-containing protein